MVRSVPAICCYLPAIYCNPPRNPPAYLPAIHLLATSIPLCSIPQTPQRVAAPLWAL